jgi:CIC family chloride channel protein
MLDFTAASMMPMLVSAVTATVLTYLISGTEASFSFLSEGAFRLENVHWVLLLGVCCGFASLYIIRGMNIIEGWCKKIESPWWRMLLGATVLGALIFVLPPLYGEGYDAIESLINNNPQSIAHNSFFEAYSHRFWVLMLYFLLIIFFKVFASAMTNGAGGVGGVFAPSLFMGAFVGYTVAALLNHFGIADVSAGNFALMGMAGVMSGVMHAPLTGIFLIAELTGGYSFFLPLMIVAVASFLTIIIFEKHSIYSMRLAQKGQLLTHHKDKAVLTLMRVENVIETDFDTVDQDMTLGDLVHIISSARRNIFPVIDNFGHLLGVVQLDDLREDMFKRDKWGRSITHYMIQPPYKILEHEQIQSILPHFEENHTWMLPVVDRDNRYLGFISKSRILNAYREALVKISQ